MLRNFTRFLSDDPMDVLLNPHRTEEHDRARAAGASRLQALGVRLTGTETSDEIGDLLDAIEAFEEAVESRGGDLMIDEGPHGVTAEPESPDFVLPRRGDHESVAAFRARLFDTASRLRESGHRR
jgi:hypothetical protein